MRTLLFVAAVIAFPVHAQKADDAQIKRGRYLVQIGGCNDCHTPAYPLKGGKVPEAEWLTGDALGWHGPWGTTYATNLRLYFQDLTEDQWVKKAKALNARPPMPWFNVRDMTSGDLRAMYRYIRHLGPAGKPAPAYLPPDKTPPQPYVAFPK
jgi:mono/diheme cytochrome c family protein